MSDVSNDNKFSNDSKGFMLMPILLLAAVLLSAAAYLLLLQPDRQTKTTGGETRVLTQQEIQQITTQSASDEVSAIEQDLGSTDLDAADSELTNLESELNAALQE
ncbi:MAG: hypothetical protein HYS83_02835 [Candidatus Blackburnbacteria bacterium]|nr:hypothetical protein [Candidatus Blackburnbacteria bacterium]